MNTPDNAMPNVPPQSAGSTGMPTWAKILLIIVALPFVCILVAICVIVILALLGPAIGNVFSNIIYNI